MIGHFLGIVFWFGVTVAIVALVIFYMNHHGMLGKLPLKFWILQWLEIIGVFAVITSFVPHGALVATLTIGAASLAFLLIINRSKANKTETS